MKDDPVVAEVHATRERLLREYGGMKGLLEELKLIEGEMQDRVVRLEPRKPVETQRRVS